MTTPLSEEVLEDILAKAGAACGAMPTPWRYSQDPCDDTCGWVESAKGGTPTGGYDGQWLKEPAEFVAAANPATVTALVREVQQFRAETKTQREAKDLARDELASEMRESARLRAVLQRIANAKDDGDTYEGNFGWMWEAAEAALKK